LMVQDASMSDMGADCRTRPGRGQCYFTERLMFAVFTQFPAQTLQTE
jgi:hypothetical protein